MVPSCWYCNWLKNEAERPYSDYVHAYFAPYPDVYFLITDITVKNLNVGLIMRIDKNAIGNTTLANQTESQFQNLDLYTRYTKNGSSYIADILSNLKCTNDEEIKLSLAEEANKCEQIFKKNHWKTSIARGLMNSNLITMEVVNHYRKKRYLKVEQGV